VKEEIDSRKLEMDVHERSEHVSNISSTTGRKAREEDGP
jgi:hypothetical protein